MKKNKKGDDSKILENNMLERNNYATKRKFTQPYTDAWKRMKKVVSLQ